MYFKLFKRLEVLFDEDRRKQLKRKEHLEEILDQLKHKKSNLLKKINSNKSVYLHERLKIIDMFITKAKGKLKDG